MRHEQRRLGDSLSGIFGSKGVTDCDFSILDNESLLLVILLTQLVHALVGGGFNLFNKLLLTFLQLSCLNWTPVRKASTK